MDSRPDNDDVALAVLSIGDWSRMLPGLLRDKALHPSEIETLEAARERIDTVLGRKAALEAAE